MNFLKVFADLPATNFLQPAADQLAQSRFEYFSFSQSITMEQMWSRLDQKLHRAFSLALKVTLIIPALFLAIDLGARALQMIGNLPIRCLNFGYWIFCQRTASPLPVPSFATIELLAKAKDPSSTKSSVKIAALTLGAEANELIAIQPPQSKPVETLSVQTNNSAKLLATSLQNPEPTKAEVLIASPPLEKILLKQEVESANPICGDERSVTSDNANYLNNSYFKTAVVGLAILFGAICVGKLFGLSMNPFRQLNAASPGNCISPTGQSWIEPEPSDIPSCPASSPAIIDANGILNPTYLENQTFVDDLLQQLLQHKAATQNSNSESSSLPSYVTVAALFGMAFAAYDYVKTAALNMQRFHHLAAYNIPDTSDILYTTYPDQKPNTLPLSPLPPPQPPPFPINLLKASSKLKILPRKEGFQGSDAKAKEQATQQKANEWALRKELEETVLKRRPAVDGKHRRRNSWNGSQGSLQDWASEDR